jgi:hypothetical protein
MKERKVMYQRTLEDFGANSDWNYLGGKYPGVVFRGNKLYYFSSRQINTHRILNILDLTKESEKMKQIDIGSLPDDASLLGISKSLVFGANLMQIWCFDTRQKTLKYFDAPRAVRNIYILHRV